jgi:L-fuculose-phosphate aldolase
MPSVRQQLAAYGQKIAAAGLTAGAGGNISAREGRLIWVKPSGVGMAELTGPLLCAVDLDSGRTVEGRLPPTSELPMHLAIYRARSDVMAVFHTHSPWASGIISAGIEIRPMFAEVVVDVGDVALVPYLTTGTEALARAVAEAARAHDAIFLKNHGVVSLGRSMKQAFYRACVVEDAAKSFVAASIVGKPEFLTSEQIAELKKAAAAQHRLRMMETEDPAATS